MATRAIDYRHGDTALSGLLVTPEGDGPHPTVLVFYDARGLGPEVKRRAAMLAEAGYAAFVADLYGDGQYNAKPAGSGPALTALNGTPGRLRERVRLAYDTLRALPEVDAERIATIGYCFGGMCALELVRMRTPLAAAITYHAALKTGERAAPDSVSTLVAIFIGAKDPHAPAADIEAVRAEMIAAGADLHLTVYGNGEHSFTTSDAGEMTEMPGLRYDPLLDRLSWEATLTLLDTRLRRDAGATASN